MFTLIWFGVINIVFNLLYIIGKISKNCSIVYIDWLCPELFMNRMTHRSGRVGSEFFTLWVGSRRLHEE